MSNPNLSNQANQSLEKMRLLGFTVAPDPKERRGKLWWAGFGKNGKYVYAWGVGPSQAVIEAAKLTLKEFKEERINA